MIAMTRSRSCNPRAPYRRFHHLSVVLVAEAKDSTRERIPPVLSLALPGTQSLPRLLRARSPALGRGTTLQPSDDFVGRCFAGRNLLDHRNVRIGSFSGERSAVGFEEQPHG